VTRDACISLALSEMGRIIANTVFVSRDDVDNVRLLINAAFAPIEEEVADQMDSLSFRALIGLHASIIAHLVETARPLPLMLTWRFSHSWPTLVIAYKLYADASHADELRNENKVVHPAFALPQGRGLSG
jgi:prophage DNA circulation protein